MMEKNWFFQFGWRKASIQEIFSHLYDLLEMSHEGIKEYVKAEHGAEPNIGLRSVIAKDVGVSYLLFRSSINGNRTKEKNRDERVLNAFSFALWSESLAIQSEVENNDSDAWAALVQAAFVAGLAVNETLLAADSSAQSLASKSHAENRAIKRDAKKFWEINIDIALPAPKAAEILRDIVPLSHRRLEEWVREWKKETKTAENIDSISKIQERLDAMIKERIKASSAPKPHPAHDIPSAEDVPPTQDAPPAHTG